MRSTQQLVAILVSLGMAAPQAAVASSHREAPITALDHKADITDIYAFRSYESGKTNNVTLIMCVDPLLDPANGPNWFPFDPDILYEIKVDNDNDAKADVTFQMRFQTEQRLPRLFQVFAGVGDGVKAPANSPAPVAPGTLLVPPRIDTFDSPGLGQRQTYTVTMLTDDRGNRRETVLNAGGPMYAVPANPGPRTMNYSALFEAGIYTASNGVRAFAGTVDDPFWIDLGGTFDTLNTSLSPPVLSAAQDAAKTNIAADTVSGYAVNAIAIEVPITMLTRTGILETADSAAATIGVWATTSRQRTTVRRNLAPAESSGNWVQVQRLGNPLINELLVGTGSKDRFSMDEPHNDSQFAAGFLDPTVARVINAATGGAVPIPTPPRNDLIPLVRYAPPIAAAGTEPGPIADLLRLNLGVAPTPEASINRLGLLAGDGAGFPNGRRLQDDAVDIALRAVAGVLSPGFGGAPNNALGDGVNVNDRPYRSSFPYLAESPSGRDRRHIDPGEAGCTGGAGAACLP
jgi:hypothetical protein